MGDIGCKVCGEPWDAWGAKNGDMTGREYEAFRMGLGCPSCEGKADGPETDQVDFWEDLTDSSNEDGDPVAVLEIAMVGQARKIGGLTWKKFVGGKADA